MQAEHSSKFSLYNGDIKMKLVYYFLIGIALGMLSGCDEFKSKNCNSENLGQYDKVGRIYKVTIENHSYLVRHDGYAGGICHDENCECKNK